MPALSYKDTEGNQDVYCLVAHSPMELVPWQQNLPGTRKLPQGAQRLETALTKGN